MEAGDKKVIEIIQKFDAQLIYNQLSEIFEKEDFQKITGLKTEGDWENINNFDLLSKDLGLSNVLELEDAKIQRGISNFFEQLSKNTDGEEDYQEDDLSLEEILYKKFIESLGCVGEVKPYADAIEKNTSSITFFKKDEQILYIKSCDLRDKFNKSYQNLLAPNDVEELIKKNPEEILEYYKKANVKKEAAQSINNAILKDFLEKKVKNSTTSNDVIKKEFCKPKIHCGIGLTCKGNKLNNNEYQLIISEDPEEDSVAKKINGEYDNCFVNGNRIIVKAKNFEEFAAKATKIRNGDFTVIDKIQTPVTAVKEQWEDHPKSEDVNKLNDELREDNILFVDGKLLKNNQIDDKIQAIKTEENNFPYVYLQNIISKDDNFLIINDKKIFKDADGTINIINADGKVRTITLDDNLKKDIAVFAEIENLFKQVQEKEDKKVILPLALLSNTGKEEYPHEDTSYGDSQPKKIAAFIKTKIKDDIKVCFTTNKDINTLFGDNGEIGKKQEATKQNITKQALEEIGLESCLVGKINVNDGKLEAVKSLEKAKNILNIKNEDGIKLNDENFTNTQLSVGENHKVINKDLPHLIKKKTTELQANQDEIKNIIPDDNNDDFFKEYNDLANIVKKIDSGDKAKVFIDYTKEESPKAQEVETLLLGLDPGLADTKALLGGDTNINYTNKNSKEKEKNGTYQQKLSIALKHATAAIGETSINKDHAKILSKIENAKIFEEAKNYDYINIDYDNIGKFSKSEKEHLEGLIGKNPEAILNFYSKKENVEKEEPSYENEAVDAKFTKATQPLSLGDNKIYFVIGQKCYIRQAKDSNFKIEDKMEDDKNTEIGKYTKTNFVLRDHPKAVFLTQENKDSLKINFAELVDSGFGLIIDSWEDLKDITSDKCKTAITAKLTKNSITFGKPTSKVKGLTIIIEREGHIIH